MNGVLNYGGRTVSIDYSAFGDNPVSAAVPANLIETPTQDADMRLVVQDWMSIQPESWRYLLYLRFWKEMSQAEIARHLGISRAAVSKQFKRIFAKARPELADSMQ